MPVILPRMFFSPEISLLELSPSVTITEKQKLKRKCLYDVSYDTTINYPMPHL